jgi:hypothetical protein
VSTASAARLLPDDALQRGRVVAILRGTSGQHLHATAQTLLKTGVGCLEVTMNMPGALETVRALRGDLSPEEACLGVGTVRTVEQVDQAAAAGVSFVVSPRHQRIRGRLPCLSRRSTRRRRRRIRRRQPERAVSWRVGRGTARSRRSRRRLRHHGARALGRTAGG